MLENRKESGRKTGGPIHCCVMKTKGGAFSV